MNSYRTSDLGSVAALLTLGIKYSDVDTSDLKKIIFIYTDDETLQRALGAYYNNVLQLPAYTYWMNIKIIRTSIANAKLNSGQTNRQATK
jgi:hypothetical protein